MNGNSWKVVSDYLFDFISREGDGPYTEGGDLRCIKLSQVYSEELFPKVSKGSRHR